MSDESKNTANTDKKELSNNEGSNPNVWSNRVDTVELELVSTLRLKKLLDKTDNDKGSENDSAADPDADVEPAAAAAAAAAAEKDHSETVDDSGDEEFSLLSTQQLQKILMKDNPVAANDDPDPVDTGFDPYNKD